MGNLYESLNAISSIDCEGNHVQGTAGDVYFRITCYRSDIFRIHYTKLKNFKKFSYAVIRDPEASELSIKDQKEITVLRTEKAELQVSKSPMRIRLMDANEDLLNEDDPGLGTGWSGNQVTTHKRLQKDERFLGLGEKTGNLDRAGEGFTNWNTDAFGYYPGRDPIYSTVPFYIGLHQGRSYGIFMDNSHKSHFNFGASNHRFSSFTAEDGDMDYYLIVGAIPEIIEAYTWLTGRMEMPPRWSLGYQQCRYSYYPEHEFTTLARTFRDRKIPCDVLYHDIHYMDEYKVFTWDDSRFPDPKRMIDEVKDMGFHVTAIVDPGVKIEKGYDVYEDGVKKDVFLKYPDGEPYSADVWPGTCNFPDFTKPSVRKWWGTWFSEMVTQGVEGFWNDMNEIATWGNAMPDILEFDYDGHRTTSHEARNVYGTQMARATKEGVETLGENQKRVMVITRAAYAGFQRVGVLWTGDNVASDESMMLGCRMLTGLGLSGLAFTGNDVGGFAGHTSPVLFARWLSISAFQPFFRAHTFVNTSDGEPWAFGEEVEEISRNYINLRYRLMPYLYAVFREATLTGMPINRSLAIYHPEDERVFDHKFENQFLLGRSILVAPVESEKEISKVFLPEGKWYNIHSDECHTGDQVIYCDCPLVRLPVFARAGTVLPMQSLVQHTGEDHDGTLRLHVYAGGIGSEITLYEDDGITKDNLNGHFAQRQIEYDGGKQLSISAKQGEYGSKFDNLKLYLHGFPDIRDLEVNGNGKEITVSAKQYSFFEPISKFDPFGDRDKHPYFRVQVAVIGMDETELNITWEY